MMPCKFDIGILGIEILYGLGGNEHFPYIHRCTEAQCSSHHTWVHQLTSLRHQECPQRLQQLPPPNHLLHSPLSSLVLALLTQAKPCPLHLSLSPQTFSRCSSHLGTSLYLRSSLTFITSGLAHSNLSNVQLLHDRQRHYQM